ncbi:odorant receptor 46a-like [Anoplolepis gracilipes]|uniref:odorant receptor 46a-like n=1 Tax=Anoplolepis gracilipes TaxID=354296 RepID=UPI003BA1482C
MRFLVGERGVVRRKIGDDSLVALWTWKHRALARSLRSTNLKLATNSTDVNFVSKNTRIQMLSLNFLIYTVGGVWRPIKWSSNCAKLLYNVFTIVIIVALYFLVLTQFMDIVLIIDNMDDFATNSLMFTTIVSVCCKATIAVVRRNAIIDLIETLLKDPCKPRNKAEMAIQMKFNEFIRSFSIKYSLLATSSMTSFLIRSVTNIMQGNLPLRAWLPYDSNESLMFFWFTSIHQIVALIFASFINVGTDTLIFGLFLQTCVQFEIFECRLQLAINKTARCQKYFSPTSSDNGRTMISRYVGHHLRIYDYAKTVNSVFNQVLFCQFFGSILILCTTVYYMSTHITGSEVATLLSYIIGMFVQIFVYCWSGNEVILKSNNVGNAVYNMNWFFLSISERKDLLMIMKRSTIPIKFTSSFLITFSLESYSNVLKTSYSAFNVLQRS